MLDGLFAFIWQTRNSAPNPQTLVSRMQEAKFKTAIVKVVDGKDSYPIRAQDEPFMQDCIAALRDANIGVWGWGAFYGAHPDPAKNRSPEDQAQKTVERIIQFNLPGFAIDVENFSGTRWSPDLASRFMATLQTGLHGRAVELALCSYRFPRLHGNFPLVEFAAGCSLMMPQVYWIKSQPVADLVESIRQYEALAPDKPYMPLGTAAPSEPDQWRPTPGEITAFLDKSRARNLPAYGFWTLQHAFADPAIWQTIVNYPTTRALPRREPVDEETEDSAPTAGIERSALEVIQATGTVTGSSVHFRDAPSVSGVSHGQLQNGTSVKVTGRQKTSDPEHVVWYRVEINGETFWMSADFVQLNALPIDTTTDPLLARLNKRVALTAGVQLSAEQLQALVDLLEGSNLWLRGRWSQTDLEELITYLSTLKEYGVSLQSAEVLPANSWTFDEVRLVYRAVMTVARYTHQAFSAQFGNHIQPQEQAFCFRTLYAPLRFSRVDQDNLKPEDPLHPIWAVNNGGFFIKLGNRVFHQTLQVITTSAGASPKFTPEELVMHEISHIIGQRRRLSNGTRTFTFDTNLTTHHFADNTVVTLSDTAGLLARARSNPSSEEVIADMFANAAAQKFTINQPGSSGPFNTQEDREGRARIEQVEAIMRQVIEFRLKNFKIDQSSGGPQPALRFVESFAEADTQRCTTLRNLL